MQEARNNREKDIVLLQSFQQSLKLKASEELKKSAHDKKLRSRTNLPDKKQQPKNKPLPTGKRNLQEKPQPLQLSAQPSTRDLDHPAESSTKAAREDNKFLVYMTNDGAAEDLQPLNAKSMPR